MFGNCKYTTQLHWSIESFLSQLLKLKKNNLKAVGADETQMKMEMCEHSSRLTLLCLLARLSAPAFIANI